jgi:hypothetical protein
VIQKRFDKHPEFVLSPIPGAAQKQFGDGFPQIFADPNQRESIEISFPFLCLKEKSVKCNMEEREMWDVEMWSQLHP